MQGMNTSPGRNQAKSTHPAKLSPATNSQKHLASSCQEHKRQGICGFSGSGLLKGKL